MTAQAQSKGKSISQYQIRDLKDLITTPKATLCITDSIAKAMQLYRIYNNPYLVMVDEEDKVIGILREDTLLEYCYDLLQRTTGATSSRYELAYHDLSSFVQKTSPILKLEDGLDKVINYVLNTKFNLFPIVDDNEKLMGTIGCRDLLEGHNEGIIEIVKINKTK